MHIARGRAIAERQGSEPWCILRIRLEPLLRVWGVGFSHNGGLGDDRISSNVAPSNARRCH